ncbi:MAG: hypothetical protein ACRCYQ_09200, partial [Nocardioides sp.]
MRHESEPGGSAEPAGPVDPGPSVWDFGDPASYPGQDQIAFGADLEPTTLLAAYRRGLFPMPSGVGSRGTPVPAWFCPVERGVLPIDGFRAPRSLRKSLRRFDIRVNTAF